MIRPCADWLAQTGPQSAIERADLDVVLEGHLLFSTNPHDCDLCNALLATLESARRLGIQAGLNVVAIPNFAFGLLERRPDHILSFHTAGRFPGFTHFKRGDLPGYMVVDGSGYSGWSTLSGVKLTDLLLPDLPEAKAICARQWQVIVAANVSKYAQDEVYSPTEPLPRNYVFVPLQVAADRTQALARIPMDEMLGMVIARFTGTGVKVVVKPHPKSTDFDKPAKPIAMAEAGDIVLRFDSIHRLIAGAQAVITINSGGARKRCCMASRFTAVGRPTMMRLPTRSKMPRNLPT
jgi:hypothetical protein